MTHVIQDSNVIRGYFPSVWRLQKSKGCVHNTMVGPPLCHPLRYSFAEFSVRYVKISFIFSIFYLSYSAWQIWNPLYCTGWITCPVTEEVCTVLWKMCAEWLSRLMAETYANVSLVFFSQWLAYHMAVRLSTNEVTTHLTKFAPCLAVDWHTP